MSQIDILLSQDMLETTMIDKDLTLNVIELMSQNLESIHYRCNVYIMRRLILLIHL